MKRSLLLQALALVVFLLSPLGRPAAGDAMSMSHVSAPAMAGHCDEMPAPSTHHDDSTSEASIDCLIACSAVATAEATVLPQSPDPAWLPFASRLPSLAGRHPEADPPPPRLS